MNNINSLNTILGLRTNVAILIYEYFGDRKLCIGGAYYADKKLIPIDGSNLKLTDDVREFHWLANNLEIVLAKELKLVSA